jgi:glycosyltransferase involved in cell wall biosynthesis
LVIVGRGPRLEVVDKLRQRYGASVEHFDWLPASELSGRYDDAWLLVLPSRSEGLGRVGIEALLRGRPIVGSRVGGIPDLVAGGGGVLVEPGDAGALAEALVSVLSSRATAEELAVAAARSGASWRWMPADYADAVLRLVVEACAGAA